MANEDLQREPHRRKGYDDWRWYELPGRIEIYHRTPGHGQDLFIIPWASVRSALKRKDKPVTPKEKDKPKPASKSGGGGYMYRSRFHRGRASPLHGG